MEGKLPEVVNVLLLSGGEALAEKVRAIAPGRVNAIVMDRDFDQEIGVDWPGRMGRRNELAPSHDEATREELVQSAQVMYMAMPFPKTLPRRSRSLRWAHFGFAGVSNLMNTDWWAPSFDVSSSRGYWNPLPIAETVIAAALMFSRQLHTAVRKTEKHEFDGGPAYRGMKLVSGKTMAIVGLGGIGSQVARLAKGVGLRVTATRRSATQRQTDVDGVDVLYPAEEMNTMLGEADFIAVCAMWTPETQGLLDAAAFAATKPGAYLMNIARGEIIDEPAMIEALHSGKLAGAYLDVWYNDFELPPSPELQAAPNVVFTPHVSGRTDAPSPAATEVFLENLRRFLAGESLENVVDWPRGY